MTEANDGDIRVGTAEREAASAALADHLAAGRLDLDEYGERAAQASIARTRAELRALFTDLPGPDPLPRQPLPQASQPAEDASAWRDRRSYRRDAGYGRTWPAPPLASRLLMLMPLIALVLILTLHLWFFFLLIPLSGAILRGRAGGPRYRGWCGPGWR
jgi:uncharacterized protein DUF1707